MSAAVRRPVQVVVDSTSDLPKSEITCHNIVVVPLTVTFGERSYLDGVDMSPGRFLDELRAAAVTPTTSQPSVTAFASVFETALDAGKDVLCLTLASQLSGTHNAARLAAETTIPDRVRVVDSGTVSIHTGLAALAAARAAESGAGLDDVETAARQTLARGQILVVLETLEFLKRGGRIGRAQALIGSVLDLKPVLTVRHGEVVPLERVRTWRKALDRIVELAVAKAPFETLAVYHAGNPDDAEILADRLSQHVPPGLLIRGELGPVVTTYAGPGTVGVVPIPRA